MKNTDLKNDLKKFKAARTNWILLFLGLLFFVALIWFAYHFGK